MPREVTAELLDQLLTDLSRCFRHPARLYLVGGTSLLLTEIKRLYDREAVGNRLKLRF